MKRLILLFAGIVFALPFVASAEEVTYRFYSLPGDGYVTYSTTTNYLGSAARALVGTEVHYTEDTITSSIVSDGNMNNSISRAFLPFDTALLPKNAKIISASVNIWPYSRIVTESSGASIQVTGPTSQGDVNTLVNIDFAHSGHYSSSLDNLSNMITWADAFATTSYTSLNLNQDGLNLIQKGGYSKFGIEVPGISSWTFYSSEGDAGKRPYLEVIVDISSSSPADLFVEGVGNPTRVTTSFPSFSAIFNSGTSTALATSYQIQVSTSSAGWSNLYWDSGIQPLASATPVGVRIPEIVTTKSFPRNGLSYYWRMRIVDNNGYEGEWSVSRDYFTISTVSSALPHLVLQQNTISNIPYWTRAYSTANGGLQQDIDCSSVDGSITDLALRGVNGYSTDVIVYVTDNSGHISESYQWPQTSSTADSVRHVFHFPSPIECRTGVATFSIVTNPFGSVAFDGSVADVFPRGACVGGVFCYSIQDLYFEIIGTSANSISAPQAPSNLISSTISSSSIGLSWTDNATNEDGYQIERSVDGVVFTQIATASADAVSFTDDMLTPGTPYTYRVRAYNTGGESAYSNIATATTFPLPPEAPIDFISAALSSTEISLAWTDISVNEDGYLLERSLDGTNWFAVGSLPVDTIDYTDSGLLPMTTYFYRLHAFNLGGVSALVSTSTRTLAVAPSASTGLQVNGIINPVDVKTPKPKFSAIFQDASSTAIAMSYEIQVFNGNMIYWDSGKQPLSGNTSVGVRTRDISADILFPRDGTIYVWRIKFWDQYDNEGEWSIETALFTMKSK